MFCGSSPTRSALRILVRHWRWFLDARASRLFCVPDGSDFFRPVGITQARRQHMKVIKLVTAAALVAACATASAQIQERIIRFGNVVQPDAPLAKGMQKFAEIVAAKSGGKIKVQVIGGGALGSESQQLSSVQGGVLDMTLTSATIMGSAVKDFTMLDFPFSFTKEEQVDALVDGPWGKAVMARLPEKGAIGLGFWETGFRQFTNSRKPIVNIEDLKGLKLRVIPNPMFVESFGALG